MHAFEHRFNEGLRSVEHGAYEPSQEELRDLFMVLGAHVVGNAVIERHEPRNDGDYSELLASAEVLLDPYQTAMVFGEGDDVMVQYRHRHIPRIKRSLQEFDIRRSIGGGSGEWTADVVYALSLTELRQGEMYSLRKIHYGLTPMYRDFVASDRLPGREIDEALYEDINQLDFDDFGYLAKLQSVIGHS